MPCFCGSRHVDLDPDRPAAADADRLALQHLDQLEAVERVELGGGLDGAARLVGLERADQVEPPPLEQGRRTRHQLLHAVLADVPDAEVEELGDDLVRDELHDGKEVGQRPAGASGGGGDAGAGPLQPPRQRARALIRKRLQRIILRLPRRPLPRTESPGTTTRAGSITGSP